MSVAVERANKKGAPFFAFLVVPKVTSQRSRFRARERAKSGTDVFAAVGSKLKGTHKIHNGVLLGVAHADVGKANASAERLRKLDRRGIAKRSGIATDVGPVVGPGEANGDVDAVMKRLHSHCRRGSLDEAIGFAVRQAKCRLWKRIDVARGGRLPLRTCEGAGHFRHFGDGNALRLQVGGNARVRGHRHRNRCEKRQHHDWTPRRES